jgi:S1-C subfamily serine protease
MDIRNDNPKNITLTYCPISISQDLGENLFERNESSPEQHIYFSNLVYIIVKMDNVKIANFSDLQGYLGSKRPGDQVEVMILRNEIVETLTLKLKNQFGKYKFENSDFSEYFIGELKPISKSEANRYDIDYGVKIVSLNNEAIERTYGVGSGDIILAVEDQKVSSAQEVDQLLKKYQNKDYFEIQILTKSGKQGYIRVRSN